MDNSKEKKLGSIKLGGSFLEKYIVYTPAEFLRVYICFKALENGKGVAVDEIADYIKADKAMVYEAVTYWKMQGAVTFENGIVTPAVKDKAPKKVRFDEPPQYSPMELAVYAEKNSEVKKLFDMAQRYLGRLLSHNDLACIFSIYHWMGLSIEVIDRLLFYCTGNNHRNIRYIERVAVDWAESGIATAEMAGERIKLYNTDFRQIMRAFGQSGRNPVPSEEKYMKRWLKEYNFPVEIVVMACEKTVLNTGRAVFGYADRILEDWFKQGVRTKEDIAALEAKFTQSRAEKADTSKTAVQETAKKTSAKSKFAGYEQRNYDFEAFEKFEQQQREGK